MKCKQISIMMALLVVVLLAGCTPNSVDLPPGVPEQPEPVLNLTAPENVNIEDYFLLTYIKPIFFSPQDYEGQIDFSKFEDLSETSFFKEYTKNTGREIDIYPGDFLNEYEKTNTQTRIFLAEPTYENAVKLNMQQKRTLAAYSVDLGRFISSIDANQNYSFMMRNGQVITKKELRDMLSDLNDNMAYILAQIQIREEILNGQMGYSLPDVNKPDIAEFEVFTEDDFDNTISKSTAKDLFSLYTYYADDRKETHRDYSEDDFKLYKINLKCWQNDSGFVYGISEDVYPNVLLAQKDMIKEDYRFAYNWDNGFTSCTCPYTDVERLNWFLVDNMYEKITKDTINSVKEYEDIFIQNPSQHNLELLAIVYRAQLYEDIKAEKTEDLAKLWKRMHQIETKTFLYTEVMNDIDWEQHFAPFIIETDEHMETHYQSIIASDSFYLMTFMPWSSSVWFRPDELRFDDGRTPEEHYAMLPPNTVAFDDIEAFIRAENGKID